MSVIYMNFIKAKNPNVIRFEKHFKTKCKTFIYTNAKAQLLWHLKKIIENVIQLILNPVISILIAIIQIEIAIFQLFILSSNI